jgi:hypothetical protein
VLRGAGNRVVGSSSASSSTITGVHVIPTDIRMRTLYELEDEKTHRESYVELLFSTRAGD